VPVRRRGAVATRLATVGALVLAVVVVAWLMFSPGDDYDVRIELANGGQLVRGNQVKVGGAPVGIVDRIELSQSAGAVIHLTIDDRDLVPLHRGSRATVRSTSLSGIANRYVAIAPAPNSRPEIPDGGEIPAEDGQVAVDLDQILNTLDPATQRDLRTAVRNSDEIVKGAARRANAGLAALNPALSQAGSTARELARDQRLLERFIVESADVVAQVSSRPADLDEAVGNALGATSAVASQAAALDSLLARLPPTLRRANTTFVNLRALVRDLRPAVREARPAAPLLSSFLVRLRATARDATPVIARLNDVVDRPGSRGDLLGVLTGLIGVSRAAVPAFESTVKVVDDGLPVLREVRPYVPDLVGGLLNGFGGTTSGYYDANGHYVRISFQSSVYSLTNIGSLVPLPQAQQGLTGYRKNVDRRCPGAGTQTVRDRSNPYRESQTVCDEGDNPQ
jgi:phospholipid/cholesterol/gamma-HCH transport system substrate-binding protein